MPLVGHTGGFYELNIRAGLRAFVKANGLGRSYSLNTGFLLEKRGPDYVLAPVRQERVEEVGDTRGCFPGAPDFVAEVISPSGRLADVEEKPAEWLAAGVPMVVVVNPRDRTMSAYTTDSVVTLSEDDTLDAAM